MSLTHPCAHGAIWTPLPSCGWSLLLYSLLYKKTLYRRCNRLYNTRTLSRVRCIAIQPIQPIQPIQYTAIQRYTVYSLYNTPQDKGNSVAQPQKHERRAAARLRARRGTHELEVERTAGAAPGRAGGEERSAATGERGRTEGSESVGGG